MRCLSVLDSCKTICKKCIDSHNKYVSDAEAKIVRDAIAVLESRKYVVIRPLQELEKVV